MNKSNGTIASVKETSTLVRPVFGPGMLLQHEDLEQLNAYTRELSRLMFRSLFGCGVVCGLVVDPPTEECGKVYVTVHAGLALDCSGDPVYVPKDKRFVIDENCDQNITGPLWVVLCGTTKHCAPRTSMCAADDDEATSVCTRERDMFEIRVVNGSEPPKCACGCNDQRRKSDAAIMSAAGQDHCLCADPTCHADHYAGVCGCNCGDGSNCDCECILLARLDKKDSGWTVDHRVRRFIRPMLMRDPQVEIEENKRKAMNDQLLKAAQEKTQVDEQFRKAVEDKRQAEQQLSKVVEEKEQMEEQLRKIEAEKRQAELNKTPEVKGQKQLQKKGPRDLEAKA
jgi:hypothetical protein